MADVPVGTVPAPGPVAAAGVSKVVQAQQAKAAKLAAVNAGLKDLDAKSAPAPKIESPVAPVETVTPGSAEKPADPPSTEAAPVKDPAPEVKADDDKPDPKTQRALDAIDKQAKRFREEQAKARADFELERAEFARQQAEFRASTGGFDELKKLARRDLPAALKRLGYESEDDYEVAARTLVPLTKTGKADPRNKQAVEQLTEKQQMAAELAELKQAQSEMREKLEAKEKAQATQAFVDKYLDEAVKAIPSEPTLIGKLHTKSPEKARQALLAIGQYLEKANDETPTHAEVIAAYEKYRREELEEQGVDVDAMLKPKAIEVPKQAPSKTLDPTAVTGTRPINGNPTKAERLLAASKGLHKLWSEQS